MSLVLSFISQQTGQPIKVMKNQIKSFRNVDFRDGSGSVRIITFVDDSEAWVTASLEEIEKLLNDD